jgi:hypothetical protein
MPWPGTGLRPGGQETLPYTDTKEYPFNFLLISFLPFLFSCFFQYFIEVFLHIVAWMSNLNHFWQEWFHMGGLESNKLMWTDNNTFLRKLFSITFFYFSLQCSTILLLELFTGFLSDSQSHRIFLIKVGLLSVQFFFTLSLSPLPSPRKGFVCENRPKSIC